MSSDLKFYYPEVGLDEAKSIDEHLKDLRYYLQDGNIPAIEKIEEICGWLKMPFEADLCKFAKESVQIENEGKLPYNIGDIKKDVAEALRDDGFYFGEIEFGENDRSTSIHINARVADDPKDINKAEVSVLLLETWNEDGKEMSSFGSAKIPFEEFKQMPPSGFHVEHKSFDSLVNEIRMYSNVHEEVKAWTPSNVSKTEKSMDKEVNIER